MTPNLRGARILVTRPVAQAQRLCGLIEGAGGHPIRFPVLDIVTEPLAEAERQLAAASDWLIFTSTNAVDFAIAAFGGKMPGLHRPRIAAVGEATGGALRAAGWRVDCVPASDFSSEGLLAEAPMQAVAGQRCVIVRGVGGREKLAEALRARGADVAYLEVYRRVRPATDTTELMAALAAGRLNATTITSLEALENLLAMLDETSVAALRALPLVVVSERIGAAATQLGFSSVAVCRQPADAAILETLTTILNGENSGGSN